MRLPKTAYIVTDIAITGSDKRKNITKCDHTFDILDKHARKVKYVLNNGANISIRIDVSFRISANNL